MTNPGDEHEVPDQGENISHNANSNMHRRDIRPNPVSDVDVLRKLDVGELIPKNEEEVAAYLHNTKHFADAHRPRNVKFLREEILGVSHHETRFPSTPPSSSAEYEASEARAAAIRTAMGRKHAAEALAYGRNKIIGTVMVAVVGLIMAAIFVAQINN